MLRPGAALSYLTVCCMNTLRVLKVQLGTIYALMGQGPLSNI